MTVKHSTASTFLFFPFPGDWRLGLIHHPRLGMLMLAGGHVEPDETAAEAALREVEEETGLVARLLHAPAPPLPVGFPRLSVPLPWWIVEHQVPADRHEPQPHVHVDHVYVAMADSDAPCRAATPAHAFGWYTAAEIAELDDVVEDTRLQAKELLACIEDLAAVASGGQSDDLASFWRQFKTQR
ncbi:MAG: NUDIX hydrolase [Egibacteraceae bacterium]